jgi:flagellar basal-body rod protein FlgF
MRSRIETLELLANNLANAATAGFKSDRETYNLYWAPEAEDGMAGRPLQSVLPLVERNWTDLSQGTLTPTGNSLDFAISGKGFFIVAGPSERLYSRNGSFQLSGAGQLTTVDGYPVLGRGGAPLQLQPGRPVEVTPDGTIRQEGQVVGQLAVAEFAGPESLQKHGKNYFRAADPTVTPQAGSGFSIHQGKLEAANVSAPETAVRLVAVMRQFEMLQRALTLGSEMNRRSVEEVARVSP